LGYNSEHLGQICPQSKGGAVDSLGPLNAFVQAAEARSFTTAGRQLGVSSSAIGKAISRLEEQLGVRLFHRSTRTIALTPEGSSFLERCRRILGEIEAAELEFAHTRGAPRGVLRVSLPMASMLMLPALSAFIRVYPEVQLDLDFTDRLVDVIDEGFDAVVRAGVATDSRLMSRILGDFELKLVASPQYLARRGIPLAPEDLIAHACLHHRYATSGKFERWPLRRRDKDIDIMPPSTAIANTIEPLIYMAEQGIGIACLPDFAIRRQLAQGTLQSVLDEYVEHSGPFRVLWPSSRHLSPKLRVFIDFMVEHLFPAAARPSNVLQTRRAPTRGVVDRGPKKR
jgi:DNA-binding transcriptional LysR family regulator